MALDEGVARLERHVRRVVDVMCRSQLLDTGTCLGAQAVGELLDVRHGRDRTRVPSRDRVSRVQRPNWRVRSIQRDYTREEPLETFIPDGKPIRLPNVWPLAFAPYAVRRAIVAGTLQHAGRTLGAPVGAGGRVVQSIARRVVSGGQRRRDQNLPRTASQLEPGSDPS